MDIAEASHLEKYAIFEREERGTGALSGCNKIPHKLPLSILCTVTAVIRVRISKITLEKGEKVNKRFRSLWVEGMMNLSRNQSETYGSRYPYSSARLVCLPEAAPSNSMMCVVLLRLRDCYNDTRASYRNIYASGFGIAI